MSLYAEFHFFSFGCDMLVGILKITLTLTLKIGPNVTMYLDQTFHFWAQNAWLWIF